MDVSGVVYLKGTVIPPLYQIALSNHFFKRVLLKNYEQQILLLTRA